MLSTDDIVVLLRTGREYPNLEVKGPGDRSDNQLMAKVIKGALSMANRRDGGTIIIGLDDQHIESMKPGLNDKQLESWTSYDDVARKFTQHSDPPLQFDIRKIDLPSRSRVVAIHVQEFFDIPHLCRKSYSSTLSEGKLYVRSRSVPETVEVASSVQMRDLLELATEKRLRDLLGTVDRAGANLSSSSGLSDDTRVDMVFDDSTKAYEDQLEDAW